MPRSTICRLAALSLTAMAACQTLAATPAEKAPISFEEHIRPILKANCFRCHGGEEETKGGLDLRLRRFLVAGGDSGPAIAPGNAAASLLLERVRTGEMPPNDRKLTPAQIELIERWVQEGAPVLAAEPEKLDAGVEITQQERAFWAFQPIAKNVPMPAVKSADRVRTPIDAFVLSAPGGRRAEPLGRGAASHAAHPGLFRPDRSATQPRGAGAVSGRSAPDAYERAIDALLDSPRYGERWGRYWLDVAGYADSDGYTAADPPRAFAYKFRDYVIRALNSDKPLDRFITEQLAGDELATADLKHLSSDDVELLAATGFLRMAADGTGGGAHRHGRGPQPGGGRHDQDRLHVAARLERRLAQCHDHRYDPIPQADYYRLRAVFEPALDWKNWRLAGRAVGLAVDRRRAGQGGRGRRGSGHGRRRAAGTLERSHGRGPRQGGVQLRRRAARAVAQRRTKRPTRLARQSKRNCSTRTPASVTSRPARCINTCRRRPRN